jgi:hypothetical protein
MKAFCFFAKQIPLKLHTYACFFFVDCDYYFVENNKQKMCNYDDLQVLLIFEKLKGIINTEVISFLSL